MGGTAPIPKEDLESFTQHLKSSNRILALLGAGLSASSGLPTFRGAGGLWRTHDATALATPEAFEDDPGLVWQFYNYRRHMALGVQPNRAHLALAELARKHDGFMTLSQNVDGLSQRAKHPPEKLQLLHGSLFDVRCTDFYCNYQEQNFTDPISPAFAIPTDQDPTTKEARERKAKELDISNEDVPLPSVAKEDLPKCPKCKTGLIRPGVVWFGEMLPSKVINTVDNFITSSTKIDLILVIGTSASVYPAAAYVDRARARGARVAVINKEAGDQPASGLMKGDWFFQGDAAEIVPEILKSVTGEIRQPEEKL
ncbi:NAD-dependent protein deacylase-like protein [Elsinoe australis]|uniref:NAD-dependent protein deacylase-like protein n=1 Tax=Elsinoe australis TaxID=40998 RepID=A0A4V6YAT4_9PEZI|nr:NAD-dependent protein deacylase-like protein [Elsinoe australis]